jgi:hypothetical protein
VGVPTAFKRIEVDVKLEQLDKPYVPPEQATLFPAQEQTQQLPQPPSQQQRQENLPAKEMREADGARHSA